MKKYPGRPAALIALLLAALLALGCAGCKFGPADLFGLGPEPTDEPEPEPFDEPGGEIVSLEPPAMDLWQGLEFTLNGTPLQLPLTLGQLEDLGFELAPYEGEIFWQIIPGWQTMFFMTHPDCGPYPVLEGVIINPDGGDTPQEQWPVQSITITAMPQLENGQPEPVLPQAGLAGGIGFGSCLQDVFDTYGLYSELTGPEGEEMQWTVRYSQDDRRHMNFLFLNNGNYLARLQLTLTPDSWLDGTAAPTLEQLEALEASGNFEELITPDTP